MFGIALLRAGRRRPLGMLGIALLRVWDCEDEGLFGGYGSACRYYPHPPPLVLKSANFTGTVNTPLA